MERLPLRLRLGKTFDQFKDSGKKSVDPPKVDALTVINDLKSASLPKPLAVTKQELVRAEKQYLGCNKTFTLHFKRKKVQAKKVQSTKVETDVKVGKYVFRDKITGKIVSSSKISQNKIW